MRPRQQCTGLAYLDQRSQAIIVSVEPNRAAALCSPWPAKKLFT